MKSTANARFAIKSWDEKPYSEGENLPRLTRATVTKTFTGDIEGEGQVEYLMMYRRDGSASSDSSDGSVIGPAPSCSSDSARSKAAWRRSPTPSSPVREPASWAPCAVRDARKSGTASSTTSR